jgi:aspartate ammonia-lyase
VARGVLVKQVLLEKKILTEEELANAMTKEALLGPLE